MYKRGRYRRRRRGELNAYLQKILVGLSVVCIVIVCAAVAVRIRRETQMVEAKPAMVQASTVAVKTDIVKGPMAETETESDGAGGAAKGRQESVIVIDPGHGGIDGGCVFEGIVEKDINRMISAQVVARLRKMGYRAELAREGDEYIDKSERVENANEKNALLYISIHQNSCEDGSVAGLETWYDGSDTGRDSGRLAQLIQQETVRATGAVSRELISESGLCVTSKSTMPSCLIETGFLSNKEERGKLATREYRGRIADGIAEGIAMYLASGGVSSEESLEQGHSFR